MLQCKSRNGHRYVKCVLTRQSPGPEAEPKKNSFALMRTFVAGGEHKLAWLDASIHSAGTEDAVGIKAELDATAQRGKGRRLRLKDVDGGAQGGLGADQPRRPADGPDGPAHHGSAAIGEIGNVDP